VSNITESQTRTPETTSTQTCKYSSNTISGIYHNLSRYSTCKTIVGKQREYIYCEQKLLSKQRLTILLKVQFST